MAYLILATDDKRIVHISNSLDHQSNGNYLINNGTLAIPPSICTLVEVNTVPDGVELEKWCYIDGQFVPNPNWREPEFNDVDEILNIIEEGIINGII